MKLKVKAKNPAGFRRCGMKFTAEAVEVEVDEKTAKILKAEPLLSVEEAKAKTPPPPPAEVSTDMNADQAIEKIAKMNDAATIKAFVKGDDRKTVKDAAAVALDSFKQ